MKPFLYLIIFSIIVSSNYAQDSCKVENPNGLQFQIDQDFQLTNFSGYTFSYRYFLNEKSGFRFGLKYSLTNYDRTFEETEEYTEQQSIGSNELDGFGFAFSVQYHHIVINKKNVNFYVGIGPFVGKTKSKSITDVKDLGMQPKDFSRNESDDQYIGLLSLVGVEYKFSNDFAISAEIGISGQYMTTETDLNEYHISEYSTYRKSTHSESDSFQILEYPAKMGLTLFF
ncbi:MAG: outer membrane beta-barrel protein [Melioribacteraceae bacterium]